MTESGSIERQNVKEPGKNEEPPRSMQDKVGIKQQSEILEPKRKICDIPSQLYAAPQLDILFVPFDEKLATCIASRGLEPCPRMALKHSKKVTDIVFELTEIWKTALEAMGPGGIRLKAPDNSPVAFQAFSWGDPSRDAGISVRLKFAYRLRPLPNMPYLDNYADSRFIDCCASLYTGESWVHMGKYTS